MNNNKKQFSSFKETQKLFENFRGFVNIEERAVVATKQNVLKAQQAVKTLEKKNKQFKKDADELKTQLEELYKLAKQMKDAGKIDPDVIPDASEANYGNVWATFFKYIDKVYRDNERDFFAGGKRENSALYNLIMKLGDKIDEASIMQK